MHVCCGIVQMGVCAAKAFKFISQILAGVILLGIVGAVILNKQGWTWKLAHQRVNKFIKDNELECALRLLLALCMCTDLTTGAFAHLERTGLTAARPWMHVVGFRRTVTVP